MYNIYTMHSVNDWSLQFHSVNDCSLLQAYYYFALLENFVLRFAWTITISVGEAGMMKNEVLMTVLASCEVLRSVD